MSAKKIFDILYDPEDYIVYGNRFCRNSIKNGEYAVSGKPYTHWDTKGKVMSLSGGEFILLNPVLPNTTRKKENICKFRSFLLESDTLPLEDQKKVFLYAMKYHKLPLSYLLFSGNKSYHGVITLEEPITKDNTYLKYNAHFLSFDEEYHTPSEIFSNIHTRLVKKMDDIVKEMMALPDTHKGKITHTAPNIQGQYFDHINKDVTRLGRFPEGKGQWRKKQHTVIALHRATKKEFLGFLGNCPTVKFWVKPKEEDLTMWGIGDKTYSKDSFFDKCSEQLRGKIRFIQNNSGDSEMHQTVRGFFLALFKEYKLLTEEQGLEVAEDHIYPSLIAAGYDQAKLYKNTTISWCHKTSRRTQ